MYITSSKSGGGRMVSKIAIPKYTESLISLTDADVIETFDIENFAHHQGAVIKDKLLYIFGGVPAWGDTNHLSIIDLQNKKNIALINIMDTGFKVEAEGAFFYKNCLYCATNRTGVYKFVIQRE